MTAPMRVLSGWQPWWSLIALGVKWIETRPQPAPKNIIGQRIALAAALTTKAVPRSTLRNPQRLTIGDYTVENDGGGLLLRGDSLSWPYRLPLGAVVATGVLAASVPMVKRFGEIPTTVTHRCLAIAADSLLLVTPNAVPVWRDVSDQRPYGDFRPGRWAYLLADVEPLAVPVPFKGGQGWSRSWTPGEVRAGG